MRRSPSPVAWVVFWIAVTLIAVLLPSPREWGAFGEWFSPHFDKIRGVAQPAAHFVLMAAIAFSLVMALAARPPLVAWAAATVTCLLLSGIFEWLQTLLPVEFARDADLSDIVSSLLGAMVGSGLAVWFQKHQTE